MPSLSPLSSFVQCNNDLKFLDLEGLPLFYRNILTVWQILHSKVPLSVNEIKEEILWNNRFIKIGGKTVFYKAWVSKGILRIKDILNAHDNFHLSKTLKILFTFLVPFLITVVFWPRFLKSGKILSYKAIRKTPTNQR